MKRLLLAILLVSAFTVSAIAGNIQSQDNAVSDAALSWLTLVDNGSCTASWENASEQFRQATTSGQWCQAVTSARTPFGKLLSRKLVAETQSLSLPGAPDGEYVVMRFASSFEKKSEGVETVTFSRERDGVWRAAGYFVK